MHNNAERRKRSTLAILLDIVDFITSFIDKCHHSKEEQGLFPALEATGMPRENSAIGTMLREHEEARKIAEQIQHAVESYTNNKNEQSGIHANSILRSVHQPHR